MYDAFVLPFGSLLKFRIECATFAVVQFSRSGTLFCSNTYDKGIHCSISLLALTCYIWLKSEKKTLSSGIENPVRNKKVTLYFVNCSTIGLVQFSSRIIVF